MPNIQSSLSMSGVLEARVIRAQQPPLSWRLRNRLRRTYIWGKFCNAAAQEFTRLTGIPTIVAELEGLLIKADGTRIDLGVLSRRVVTDAGVAFLVDDWDNDAQDITNMHFHASGTDGTAENAADTALGTEATTVTDRATGTESQPAANQLRTVGTQSFTGSAAIVEHGILSSVTEGAGTLWDRSVFSAINVGNGDSIQWTYTCTINSGG